MLTILSNTVGSTTDDVVKSDITKDTNFSITAGRSTTCQETTKRKASRKGCFLFLYLFILLFIPSVFQRFLLYIVE